MMTRMVMMIVVMVMVENFHDYDCLLKFLIVNLLKDFDHGNEDSDDSCNDDKAKFI